MPSYNFKRKVKFYVIWRGLQHRVDIYPDISFSQTFNESSRKVKTLHTQTNMFDKATITEANPANFEFTMPLYVTLEVKEVLNLLLKYNIDSPEVTLETADIYVDTGQEVFRLETAVFERGVFNINRGDVVSVSISGTASKLSRYGASGITIPGVPRASTDSSSTFLTNHYMLVQVNGVEQPSIHSASIEVANTVQWTPNNTLHKSLAVNGPSDTVYPEGFVVSGRTVSGLIQQYITDENLANVNKWAIEVPLNIRIARIMGNYSLSFLLDKVVYTNRLESADLFLQNYDFRLTSSPSDLSTLIQYV